MATYFCFVDILLAGQYAYYTRLKSQRSQNERQLLATAPVSTATDYGTAGFNTGNGSGFTNVVPSGSSTPTIGATEFERSPLLRASRHSILSAELDVARAAERVERRRSQSARRKIGPHLFDPEHQSSSQHQPQSAAVTSPLWTGTESTQSSTMLSANDKDSFRGRPRGRPASDAIDMERGDMQQPYGRSISTSPQAKLKQLLPTSSAPATVKRTTSSGGQRPRAAGVVFMSVFLLAGIGRTSWKGLQEGSRRGSGGKGQVIVPQATNSNWNPSILSSALPRNVQEHFESAIIPEGSHIERTDPPTYISITSFPDEASTNQLNPSSPDKTHTARGTDKGDKPTNGQGHYQRIVGRVSAWVCTTLYLTSRLPQIWKNVSHGYDQRTQLTSSITTVYPQISRGPLHSPIRLRIHGQCNIRWIDLAESGRRKCQRWRGNDRGGEGVLPVGIIAVSTGLLLSLSCRLFRVWVVGLLG